MEKTGRCENSEYYYFSIYFVDGGEFVGGRDFGFFGFWCFGAKWVYEQTI